MHSATKYSTLLAQTMHNYAIAAPPYIHNTHTLTHTHIHEQLKLQCCGCTPDSWVRVREWAERGWWNTRKCIKNIRTLLIHFRYVFGIFVVLYHLLNAYAMHTCSPHIAHIAHTYALFIYATTLQIVL